METPHRWPPHPYLYEIDTWPWLTQLRTREGREIDLGNVPDHYWNRIAERGVDAVWLMGVWERSPAGVALALSNPALLESFASALPDFRPEDVVGSPYCIRDYTVDPRLGGTTGLRAARDALAARGVRLVLDFVPNHVAPDHPWTVTHPERFVQGTSDDLREHPESFIEVSGRVWRMGAIRSSRHGPTSCSSTRSLPICARQRSTPCVQWPSSATACAATWRCS